MTLGNFGSFLYGKTWEKIEVAWRLEVGGWRGVFDFSLQLEMVIFFTFDDLSGP